MKAKKRSERLKRKDLRWVLYLTQAWLSKDVESYDPEKKYVVGSGYGVYQQVLKDMRIKKVKVP